MADKKLSNEIPDFDSELDFDFDADFGAGLNQEAPKKERGVITKVAVGLKDGAKDTVTSPEFIKRTLRKSLPKDYGVVAEGVEDVATGLTELYDQELKELKPRLGSVTRKIEGLTPDSASRTKAAFKKISDWLEGPQASAATDNGENAEEQAVTAALAGIFEQQKIQNTRTAKEQLLRDHIDKKRSDRSTGFLADISRNTSIATQYTTRVTHAYHQKSLELQMRGYFAQKKYISETLRHQQVVQAQLEAIVKNTAMPEFQKITTSERFMEVGRNRLMDSVYGDGSAIKKGMNSLKTSVGQLLSGFRSSLDVADMQLDQSLSAKEQMDSINEMMVEMGEPPMSKIELVAAMAGGNIVEGIRDRLSKKAREKLSNNKKFTESLAKLARIAINPGGAIRELQTSESWQDKTMDYESTKGTMYRLLDGLMDNFRDSRKEQSFKRGAGFEGLDEPTMGFSKRAHISLVDVIPGYLSAIQREIRIFRTGDESTPASIYDYRSGRFVTDKAMSTSIMKDLIGTAKRGGAKYEVAKAADFMKDGRELPAIHDLELKTFLTQLARIPDMEYTPDNIRDTRAYDNLSPVVKTIVDSKLDEIDKSEDKEYLTTQMTRRVTDITKGQESARRGLDKRIDDYTKYGYGDLIERLGFIKKDRDSDEGDYDADLGKTDSFIDRYAIKSDINVKENIKEVDPSKILKTAQKGVGSINWGAPKGSMYQPSMTAQERMMVETQQVFSKIRKWLPKDAWAALQKTKLFSWRYKRGEGDGQEHDGPMAQHVRQNFGDDTAPDGKSINLVDMNAATMAAVKHIGEKVEEKEGGEQNWLALIRKDTSAMVNLLKKGNRTGKGPVTASKDENWNDTGTYQGLLGNTIRSISDLGAAIANDVFSSAKSVFKFGNEKIAQPVTAYAKDIWTNKDNPVRKKLDSLFESATSFANSIYDFGNNMLTNRLPEGWKQIKDFGKKAWTYLSKEFNEAKDLYLPDGGKAVIRAAKLRSGFYIDSGTGEPIFTMDKLISCKNDIVDKAGNVILTVEEKAQGLYDRHGEKAKTMLGTAASAAMGAAVLAKDKVVQSMKFLKENGLSAFSKLKDKAKTKWKGMDFDGVSVGTKYARMSHDVLVDIRDILLGDIDKVRERLKKPSTDQGGQFDIPGSSSPSFEAVGDEESSPLATAASQVAANTRSGGLLAGARSLYQQGKAWKDGGGFNRIKDTVGGWRDKAANSRFGKQAGDKLASLKTAAQNKFQGNGQPGINWGAPKGQMFNPGGSKAMSVAKKIGARARGFGGGLFGMASNLASSFLGGGEEEKNAEQAAQPQDAANDANRAKDLAEKPVGLDWSAPKGKISQAARAWNDKDGDGLSDSSVEAQRNKNEALKASRKKKAAEADLTKRYGNGGGIMDMLKNVFSFITSGFGGILQGATGLLSKLPGLASGLMKSPLIAKATTAAGALLKSGVGVAAKTAGRAALMAGAKVAGLAGMAVMSTVGTAASVLAGFATSPVVLGAGALALAGYGIYRAYKYVTRNSASELDRIRLRQYGLSTNKTDDQFNNVIFTLEQYLLDGKVKRGAGGASIINRNVKNEEILEIFGVGKDDNEMAEKVGLFYAKRFKPFFLTHLTSLYSVNPKVEIHQLDKLTDAEKIKYLEAVVYDDGPYNEDRSPFKKIDSLPDTLDDVKKAVESLVAQYTKKLSEKQKGKVPLPTKPEETNMSKMSEADKAAKARREENKPSDVQKKQAEKARQNNAGYNAAILKSITGEDGPMTEGQTAAGKMDSTVPSSIAMAPGSPLEGHNGLQYLKLKKGVDLNGMHPGTLKMLLGMAEEYGTATGNSITVESAFRSSAMQAALRAKYGDRAAKPGRSLHEFGLAFDISSADAAQLEQMGLMKKYGFTRPVGGEPWHVEPAGIQVDLDGARSNAAKRDEMVASSLGKGGGGYGTQRNANKYRRNHDLAMALLNIPAKTASEQLGQKKDTGVSLPDGKFKTTTGAEPVQEAANESSASTNVISLADKASAKNQLPAPRGAGNQVQQVATEAGDAEGGNVPGTTPPSGSASAANGDIQEQIKAAAKKAGGDPNLALAFAAVESDFNPNARSKKTTAAGPFQFLTDTWKEQLGKHGRKYGIPMNTPSTDVEASTIIAMEYLKSNMKGLNKVKDNPGFTDAYLTHFLGPAGTRQFLSLPDDAIVADHMPDQARANMPYFYAGGRPMTKKQAYDRITDSLKKKTSRYGIQVNFGSLGGSTGNEKPAGMDGALGGGIGNQEPGPLGKALQKPEQSPSAVPSGPGSGVFVNARGNAPAAVDYRATTQGIGGVSMAGVEARLDKSTEIQQDQLTVLREISEKIDPAKLAEIITAAMATMKQAASNDNETLKQKDERNMNRKSMSQNPSVDISRRAM